MRTVRAFANEQLEVEKFTQQVEETQALYQKLGMGIALFQVSSTPSIFLTFHNLRICYAI